MMGDYDDRYKRGMQLLKKMGREHLMLEQKALLPDMYKISVGHLFGDIWARPGLSLRERQLVTLAANIALARSTGNYSHYRSAQHIGRSFRAQINDELTTLDRRVQLKRQHLLGCPKQQPERL